MYTFFIPSPSKFCLLLQNNYGCITQAFWRLLYIASESEITADLEINKYHLIAANVLIKNLKILHTNNILHNAINFQNYTWALELLDFELACSPSYPYTKEDDQRHVKDFFNREILYTYEIIKYIACFLSEPIDYKLIDSLFKMYGFDLSVLSV